MNTSEHQPPDGLEQEQEQEQEARCHEEQRPESLSEQSPVQGPELSAPAAQEEERQCCAKDPVGGVTTGVEATLDAMVERLGHITDVVEKNAAETHEMHRKYHGEFATRIRTMQEEIEHYREVERGRIFDPILRDLCQLYSDNAYAAQLIEDPKLKKRFTYLFLDILQIIEGNGASKQESKPGDRRSPKYCQVLERIATDDPNQHDTVAQSRSIGFYVDNRPIIKEMVDVYVYGAETLINEQAEQEQEQQTEGETING